jgi:hypothetical protein
MGRFVLRYRGSGPPPAQFVEQVRAGDGVSILDESPRMLLVEGPEAELRRLVNSAPGWLMAPEQAVPLPDPRPRPKKPPGDA